MCVCRESRVGHTEQSFVGAKMLAVSVRSAMWHDLCARRECKCPACDQQTKQPTKPEDQQNWLYSPKRAPLSLSFFHPFFLPPFFYLLLSLFFSLLVPFSAHALILNTIHKETSRQTFIYSAQFISLILWMVVNCWFGIEGNQTKNHVKKKRKKKIILSKENKMFLSFIDFWKQVFFLSSL